jgi:hypothetical protein
VQYVILYLVTLRVVKDQQVNLVTRDKRDYQVPGVTRESLARMADQE